MHAAKGALFQTTEGFCFRFEWVGGRVRKAVLPPWDQASGSGTPPSSTLMQFCQRTDVREQALGKHVAREALGGNAAGVRLTFESVLR